jgi:hypothetical protein
MRSGRLKALEAVPSETLAAFATSLRVTCESIQVT